MADEVDAAVKLVEATASDALADLVPGHARPKQLPPRHHPVLAARDPGNQPINVSLSRHIRHNPTFIAGAP